MQARVVEEVVEHLLAAAAARRLHDDPGGIVCQVRTLLTTAVIRTSVPGSTRSVMSASKGV